MPALSRSWITVAFSPSTRRRTSSAASVRTRSSCSRASGDLDSLAKLLEKEIEGIARTRKSDAGLELHVRSGSHVVGRVVAAAEAGGFDVADLSVTEPSLETVFINLTGRELRDT